MVRAETLHRLLLISILVGLAFSTYSAIESTFAPLQGTCNINSTLQCGKVDSSTYSHVAVAGVEIPLYWVGIGGFALMLLLDIPLLYTYRARYLNALVVVSAIGVVTAVVLGAVEIFLIQALCPICLGAYVSGAAVLIFALWLWRLRREAAADEQQPAQRTATG